MSIRWLAAVFLFSLGFGSAFLVRSQAAVVTPGEGIIDGKLKYKDTGTNFQLSHPADDKVSYLVILGQKGKDAAPRVAYPNGELTLSKTDAQIVGVYQVTPLAIVRFPSPSPNPSPSPSPSPIRIPFPDILKCRPNYCPLPPEPPPPGPIFQYSYYFMRDSSALPKPGR
jgi:hypothetical protein